MPPPLALFLTLSFSVVMLWRSVKEQPQVSRALWLPVVWIFFVASRFPGQWLAELGILGGGGPSMEDGSPLDAVFFLALIAAGIAVLGRRHVRVSELVRNNLALTAFFVYCFLAILWSDFPFVAFKRWIKVLGHPVMALVILTDRDPGQALRTVFKRAGIIMIPLSVTLIKYYPDWGRYYDRWTGAAWNRGIHINKNELGYSSMVFAVFFAWNLLTLRQLRQAKGQKLEMMLSLVFIVLLWWLFTMAGSATSLTCTALAVTTMLLVGSRFVSGQFIGVQLTVVLLLAVAMEAIFGIYEQTVLFLGRDPTLTDRTELWADLFTVDINVLLGAGFESFWLGPRREALWAKWWWQPGQAHSGYIETYLNLGWVGVFLLGCTILATFRKSRATLLRDVNEGRLRLAFLVAILAYNYTEAAFKGVHLVWTVFHLIALDYPRTQSALAAESQVESEAKATRHRLSLGPTAGTLAPMPSRRTGSLKPASPKSARARDPRTSKRV